MTRDMNSRSLRTGYAIDLFQEQHYIARCAIGLERVNHPFFFSFPVSIPPPVSRPPLFHSSPIAFPSILPSARTLDQPLFPSSSSAASLGRPDFQDSRGRRRRIYGAIGVYLLELNALLTPGKSTPRILDIISIVEF